MKTQSFLLWVVMVKFGSKPWSEPEPDRTEIESDPHPGTGGQNRSPGFACAGDGKLSPAHRRAAYEAAGSWNDGSFIFPYYKAWVKKVRFLLDRNFYQKFPFPFFS